MGAMQLFRYTKNELAAKASEINFVRDTLEKVLRLSDILDYLGQNPITKNVLALKGGTAINLTVFNLPRLSVDIDLDYSNNCDREEMLVARAEITEDIKKYLSTQGYILSDKSKFYHSLDSFVFGYQNLGGMNDNIKIEINYSLRAHLFAVQPRPITATPIVDSFNVLAVAPCELFAGKINALLSRAAARDLYDVYNMIKLGLFDIKEYDVLRKSVVFYAAISQETAPEQFSVGAIDGITTHKIKTDLLPVIKRSERIILQDMKNDVKKFISELVVLTENEKQFLTAFNIKEYKPELLFSDDEILNRIKAHPMALWKMR